MLAVLTAGWAVVFVGVPSVHRSHHPQRRGHERGRLMFFPLLFLTPNFVPRNLLSHPMEIAATVNPVTYVMEAMRSLICCTSTGRTSGPGSPSSRCPAR